VRWSDIQYDEGTKLDEDAYGWVYKATGKEWIRVEGKTAKEERQLELAVKKFKNQSPDVSAQKLFMREVEGGLRAQHPALLSVVSFSIFPYAIAMEQARICLGDVLLGQAQGIVHRYTDRKGQNIEFNDTKRTIAAFGIAAGMACLHENGVIHRDLKPDNVMLDEDLYPKVSDYGLSRILVDGGEVANRAITMTMGVGTWLYMAPELMIGAGDGQYTQKVDVYSYAMILYQLVTGSIPWSREFKGASGPSHKDLTGKLDKGERPVIPDTVTQPYRELIAACWSRNPVDRPSFREIVEQCQDDKLFFPETDVDEFRDYVEVVTGKK
jgi:serine/threonine protein kinase